jgi:tetratricopeptide (TPR) repeat protein
MIAMTRRGARFLVFFAVLAALGCAKRSAKTTPGPDVADELVNAGCYDCLLEARTEYERRALKSAAATVRLFEVDLLLALREKELAIDPTETLDRAGSLVPKLSKVPAEQVLSMVKVLPSDATGRRGLPPTATVQEELKATIAALDASAFSGVFKSYLKLSIQCGRMAVDALPLEDAPLLTYRRAVCENPIRVDPLRGVRKSVPRFIETSFFLGRAAMASFFRTDGREARELFEEAYARFSNSSSIAFDLGNLYQAANECRRAETLFSRALELRPAHEEARLGRTICRTYLLRNEEAIADATVLIDRSESASNRGEGFYWRAWNRRHLKQTELARSDIDRARTLRYNARVMTLAGQIEYDQREYDKARQDLESARDMEATQCEARWYLALVEYAVEAWAPAANAFASSATCYDILVKDSEAKRAQMAGRNDVSEEFRTRQLAGFDAAIAEDSVQRSASELNAAINYGRAGDLSNATTYMKLAAVDPLRRTAVEDLRQVLGVPRW